MPIYGFSELTCTRLYPKYLEFRHQVFNEILKYNESGNPVYGFKTFRLDSDDKGFHFPKLEQDFGIEYDDYDVPKAIHLAFVQRSHSYSKGEDLAGGQILGCLRFLPCDGPYMIKDNLERGIWKNVELLAELPTKQEIYEASRIAVAPQLSQDTKLRQNVLDNLVYANVELAARLGIKKMVGIMYDRVWDSVYRKRDVPITYLSKPFHVDDGPPIIIGEIDTSEFVLGHLNRRFEVHLRSQAIIPPEIDPGTWLTHYYHVNQVLPVPALMPDSIPFEVSAQ